jgi:DNA ligase D-like protein (predicted ligase)
MLDQKIAPMLAHRSEPFDSDRHIFEIKWDGTRCLLFAQKESVRLQNRRLLDITIRYPELHAIHEGLDAADVVLDGELVVLRGGKSDFKLLQQRDHLKDPLKIKLLSTRVPATYVAFDVLHHEGESCLDKPLEERRALLSRTLREWPHLLESRFIRRTGTLFFRQAASQGLEGIMAKRIDSPYLVGKRSRYWLKIKTGGAKTCWVVGYTIGKGARKKFFGSLTVATKAGSKWTYRGRVGSGFTDRELASIRRRLESLKTDAPPFPVPDPNEIQWVQPQLKCEVVFQEETAKGHFRAPVFKGLIA